MPSADHQPLCFLTLPRTDDTSRIFAAIDEAARHAGFRIAHDEARPASGRPARDLLVGQIARSEILIADLTGDSTTVYFALGLAQAMGKACFLLARKGCDVTPRPELGEVGIRYYEMTRHGLGTLKQELTRALIEHRRSPLRANPLPGTRLATPFFVDWDRLDPAAAENLCRELLAQLGYQRVDWGKISPDIDLIAELPRKDPDGFEYRELWLVSMGRRTPHEAFLQMFRHDPDMLLHRLVRSEEQLSRVPDYTPIIMLLILLRPDPDLDELERLARRASRSRRGVPPFTFRYRIWNPTYLTSLVQQFPQIGYKYFSDEARSLSKYRKSPDELYRETVLLNEKLVHIVAELRDERDLRTRAERDAVWKDVSFTAAHKIGNPIFAIETDLDPLARRIQEDRKLEALEVISNIRSATDKAKAIVEQFKSLTRAQALAIAPTPLQPILQNSCRTATSQGATCTIDCEPGALVLADSERLAECFDELTANALLWAERGSTASPFITVMVNTPEALPPQLDPTQRYFAIHFRDKGPGVPLQNKSKIFDAFFTTRDHGTGLGLALVRRIVDGHGGAIAEVGTPGSGADFLLYLPTPGPSPSNDGQG